MARKYILGPTLGVHSVAAAAPAREFVPLAIASMDAAGFDLGCPPYDPAVQVAPDEVRVYYLAPGSETPADADGFIGSFHPFALVAAAFPPEGGHVRHPHPEELPVGDYLVQTVLGYEVPDA